MKKSMQRALIILILTVFTTVSSIIPQSGTITFAAVGKKDISDQYGVSKNYFGFVLKEKKNIPEAASTAYIFQHVKTGANLLFLKNSDQERMFSISFRTPPFNDTGVNHIIEHSVLCGSKNYPVKSPFLEMTKGSLGTFINAMTAADYTTYPAASKNEKDLQNLLAVYLDAVFYPNVVSNPKIFEQEAWHYELDALESELKVSGVVYNEMKGSFSAPYSILINNINQSLFPQSTYKWVSGGNPEEILNLTRDQLVKIYKKNYTPSNAYIMLYGNIDMDKTLKFIDDKYLSKLKKEKVDTSIAAQKPLGKKRVRISQYDIGQESNTENKTYLALNYVVGKSTDSELSLSMEFLNNLLMGTPASPLKKALEDRKIAGSVSGMYNDNGLQPFLSIIAENSEESKKDQFEKVVNDTLKNIVKKGFDKDLIKSAFDQYEYKIREEKISTNKGLTYSRDVMKSWLYGGDPTLYLQSESAIAKMKKVVKDKYFEKLIEKYLLNSNHSSLIVLKPAKGLNEKSEIKLKKKLSDYKAKLTQDQLKKLVSYTKELKKWQQEPDSKEALAKIPKLTLTDLDTKVEITPTNVKTENGIKVLQHPMYTNGISFVNLYFDTSGVPQEKLHYLELLTKILGKIDTKNYDYLKLTNKINESAKSITFTSTLYDNYSNMNEYKPFVLGQIACLNNNLPNALTLTEEIINQSKLESKARLAQIIQQAKTEMEAILLNMPSFILSQRAGAYLAESGKYMDETKGLSYYAFLSDLSKNFDSRYDEIVKNLQDVSSYVFNKPGLTVSYTGEETNYSNFLSSLTAFTAKLGAKTYDRQEYRFEIGNINEGFSMPIQVQFVLKEGDFSKLGYKYSGKMKVLANIINSSYLWQEVRLKGGAYGAGAAFSSNGIGAMYSYYDPNLKETMNVFNKTPEFLKNFKATKEEMTNYIIGTIGKEDLNGTPDIKGLLADYQYFSGSPQEFLQKERQEILSTTAQDINSYAEMLQKLMDENIYCVVGSETKINENKDLFKEIKTVFNVK
ncbi:MAG: insulinase family protein [Clostridia bacterium]|nr:insulinase family protein [Clostridia bacterium]